jgi:hypothetical protein
MLRQTAMAQKTCQLLLGSERSGDPLTRFRRKFDIRIKTVQPWILSQPPGFVVKVEHIFAEPGTEPTHTQMHPQIHSTPPRNLMIERLGDELRDLSTV